MGGALSSVDSILARIRLVELANHLLAHFACVPLRSRIHNHMGLREFPLDADTISIEMFCKRGEYDDVCLHTGNAKYHPSIGKDAESKFAEKHGMSLQQALLSEDYPVWDAMSAARRLHVGLEKGSSRVLTEKLKTAEKDDVETYGPGLTCTLVKQPEGIEDMYVFHNHGLPEVVGRYGIFTLQELELRLHKEGYSQPNIDQYINPLADVADIGASNQPSAKRTEDLPISAGVVDDFKAKAMSMSMKKLNMLAKGHGLRRRGLCEKFLGSTICKNSYKRSLVQRLAEHFVMVNHLDADEGVTHTNDGYPTSLDDVMVLPHARLLHEWEVVDSCAEETSGLKVIVKLRIHRQAGFYFCKCLLIPNPLRTTTASADTHGCNCRACR